MNGDEQLRGSVAKPTMFPVLLVNNLDKTRYRSQGQTKKHFINPYFSRLDNSIVVSI